MSSSDTQQGTGRGARRSVLLVGSAVLVAVVAVVLAVVLTRGGTAATEADLTETPDPPAGSTAAGADGPAGPVLTADGLPGARLGQEVSEGDPDWADEPRWNRSGTGSSCRAVVPTSDVGAPGLDVLGWVVDGRIASLVMTYGDYPVPHVSVPEGLEMGDGLEAAAALPGARVRTERLAEPASPGPDNDTVLEELQVVTIADGDRETLYSDLGGDRGIEYVEVRDPAAAACVLEDPFAPPEVGESPTLTADGWGEVRLGRPVAELVESGLLVEGAGSAADPCELRPATPAALQQGLFRVVALDGTVAGVGVVAGSTKEGLAVGDPAESVEDVYPDAVPEPRSPLGQRSWTVELDDDLRLQVTAFVGTVVPRSVDAVLTAAQADVYGLDLRSTACTS